MERSIIHKLQTVCHCASTCEQCPTWSARSALSSGELSWRQLMRHKSCTC